MLLGSPFVNFPLQDIVAHQGSRQSLFCLQVIKMQTIMQLYSSFHRNNQVYYETGYGHDTDYVLV